MPPSQHHRPISTYQCTEKETRMVRTHVSVWYLQTPQPSAWIFEFSQFFCCAWDASATQTVGFFCVLRMRLIHRSSFMVRLQTAGQILLVLPLGLIVFDYINMTWGSINFAQKWPAEMSFRGILLLFILYFFFLPGMYEVSHSWACWGVKCTVTNGTWHSCFFN